MDVKILTVGIAIILASAILRAARKLTVDFAAFWGIAGMLFMIIGLVFPLSDWTGVLFLGGFIVSLWISKVLIRKQELVIRTSLLLKENGRKRILFVINTMGQAGAETALLGLLDELAEMEYDLFLYVLMGQGEMLRRLPPCVRVLNHPYSFLSVLTGEGRRQMACTVLKAFWHNGGWCRKIYSIAENMSGMIKSGRFELGKLFWRTVSDGAERFDTEFDMAVAWLEGGSAYYVAEYVKAKKKTAFIHTDYENAGYTRKMDRACWEQYERIFAVSGKVKEKFQDFYPEYAEKVHVFHNYMNQDMIRRQAEEPGGFTDQYDGIRILSVGRLAYPKAYDIAAEAMKLLKERGYQARWYVLGEGDQRITLEKKIAALGLKKDFILLGAVENPYPYYAQADIYVHASWHEGQPLTILEAQTLGCAIVASDCSGNREQITDGRDGILCALNPEALAGSIGDLFHDQEKREKLGSLAKLKKVPQEQIKKLFE